MNAPRAASNLASADPSVRVVRAACPHDCPDTCAMLVTVKDGVAIKVQGDPLHPFTDGSLCTKVSYYTERTYSPDRRFTVERVGRKAGRIQRISCDRRGYDCL